MRILITGGAGFVGSTLADRWLKLGHEVIIFDNFTTGLRENVSEEAALVEMDVGASWPHFKADVIVHCAASRDKWRTDARTNVLGAIHAAEAAREQGARLVYFQTALIYGTNPTPWPTEGTSQERFPLPVTYLPMPDTSYAISKNAAEQYLRLAGVPLLTFRLANIYGPRNLAGPIPEFYKRISAGERCTVVDTRRDFVYIQDLCDLVLQAVANKATGTYHVSSGRDVPIGQVYDAVLDAMDAYGHTPAEYVERGPDDAARILLDPTETQRDFSWVTTTDLDEGVNDAVAWYREHLPVPVSA